jgi:hypothetical protein
MRLFTGWAKSGCVRSGRVMSAGLVAVAAAANAPVAKAQVPAPYDVGRPSYAVVSDVDGPYAAMPPEAAGYGRPGYGPMLLPAREVYTVVRESGFSPLGIPQQRGLVYTIAVIDRGGDDGRLVIDARTGRILNFMPAVRMSDHFNADLTARYGPVGPLPYISTVRGGPPRPPLPLSKALPRVASRTSGIPLPKASPRAGGVPATLATKPIVADPAAASSGASKTEPAQQAAIVQAKPAETPPSAAPAIVEAKPPAPRIQPTQEMPRVQDLE